jgi:hypothetical protein
MQPRGDGATTQVSVAISKTLLAFATPVARHYSFLQFWLFNPNLIIFLFSLFQTLLKHLLRVFHAISTCLIEFSKKTNIKHVRIIKFYGFTRETISFMPLLNFYGICL